MAFLFMRCFYKDHFVRQFLYYLLYFVLFSRHTFYTHVCTIGCKVFHATGVVSLLSSLCMSILWAFSVTNPAFITWRGCVCCYLAYSSYNDSNVRSMCQCICHSYVGCLYSFHKCDIFQRYLNVCPSFLFL
jgi:hypothetical protein